MRRLFALIMLCLPLSAVAAVTTITVIGPTPPRVNVTGQNPPAVTVTRSVTESTTINVPGQQGPKGDDSTVPGPQGPQGPAGADGLPGPGVPVGGTDGQILTKKGLSNYSASWQDPTAGVSSWNDLTDKPDVAIKRQQATFSNVSVPTIHLANNNGNNTNYGYSTKYLAYPAVHNTFIGSGAGRDMLQSNNPSFNTLIGFNAGIPTVGASYLTVVGSDALGNYVGTGNGHIVAIGANAASYLLGGGNYLYGMYNTYIGSEVKPGADTTYHEIVLGYGGVGKGSNTTTIGTGNTDRAYIYGNISGVITKGSIPAANTTVTPTGNISEATVQAALAGLDTRMPEACGTDPSTAIFDGAPALSCAIDSGVAAFTYDYLGADPLPAMLPYTVKLYEVGLNNNEPVDYDTIAWTVPASNSLLFGNSTSATFTPTIFGTYSANRTNWIKATLTRGLKTCIAMLPISTTKEGATGATGPAGEGASISAGTTTTLEPGQPASVTFTGPSTARIANFAIPRGADGEAADITKSAVQSVYTLNAVSGGTFALRPYTAEGETDATSLLIVYDALGNKKFEVTAKGQINYHSDGTTKHGFSNYSGTVTIW